MNRYKVYRDFLEEKITEEQAAKALGITERDWRFRQTKYGSKLPKVLMTMDRIDNDEITRDEAAKVLNVTARQVNNLMKSWNAGRPIKEYLINRAVSSVKWELRKKFAVEYIAGTSDFETAALGAEVSVRQMRRWVEDLLQAHYGITTKDLKHISLSRRGKMADEIEEREGLEYAKINVLNEVAKGLVAIEEVALRRVMSKRTLKGRQVVQRRDPGHP